ncbi:MAG: hypothetical protein HYV51_00690 [Parcubacteria group bacterium]|nr:hypothetical protein [Parcubacteria group bacterium]
MPELTREEKLKLIEQLPQRLQDFLYSEDTGAFLLYLGQKYNLPNEKVSALSKIIADIILKITPITSLAQEIVNKVIIDPQIAMVIAQELNSELLILVLMPTPAAPIAPLPIAQPVAPPALPTPQVGTPTSPLANVGADQYRESTTSEPAPTPKVGAPTSPRANVGEIIDLRKTPPSPLRSFSEGGLPPGLPVAAAPAYIPPPRPLTFTKPVEPPKPIEKPIESIKPVLTPSLIEANPHKTPTPAPTLQPLKETPEERPQFIVRPPGLPPIPTPHDVLDLRKDKGEF